jgi:hypothetical protein
MNKLKCLRCGNEWQPKVAKPKVCPRCHSPYWNQPYRKMQSYLHPDEKPEDILTQYINENPIVATPEPVDETTGVILKTLTAIMDRLDKIESRPTVQQIYNDLTPEPTKAEASESFTCAKTHQFICNMENKPLCGSCKSMDFWNNAHNLRIALEMEDIEKPGEVVPEDSFEVKAMNCKDRETNAGLPFCVHRYKGIAHHNYCLLCWELEAVWGNQAAGYMERRKEK